MPKCRQIYHTWSLWDMISDTSSQKEKKHHLLLLRQKRCARSKAMSTVCDLGSLRVEQVYLALYFHGDFMVSFLGI